MKEQQRKKENYEQIHGKWKILGKGIKIDGKFAWSRGGSKQVVMSRRESEKVPVKYGWGMRKVRKGTRAEIKRKKSSGTKAWRDFEAASLSDVWSRAGEEESPSCEEKEGVERKKKSESEEVREGGSGCLKGREERLRRREEGQRGVAWGETQYMEEQMSVAYVNEEAIREVKNGSREENTITKQG